MGAEKKKQKNVLGLIVALVAVLFGGVLFVGAVSGWFSGVPRVVLDAEYYCGEECDGNYMELSGVEYEELIEAEKSFMVFVDQGGCKTADRLRGYVSDYAKETGIRIYRIMFNDMKETSLHEFVKYYPSVAVISRGKPVVWLRADSDEDAKIYNERERFIEWARGVVVEKSTANLKNS